MKTYLLDTNVLIFFIRDKFGIKEKLAFVGLHNCCISEVTLAELKIGAEKSNNPSASHTAINTLTERMNILPITPVLDIFAKEKVRLERSGKLMHDHFDVLIAATALFHNLTVVTNNVKDFSIYPTLDIEDWTQPTLPLGFV